jgi:hypothetical protein
VPATMPQTSKKIKVIVYSLTGNRTLAVTSVSMIDDQVMDGECAYSPALLKLTTLTSGNHDH